MATNMIDYKCYCFEGEAVVDKFFSGLAVGRTGQLGAWPHPKIKRAPFLLGATPFSWMWFPVARGSGLAIQHCETRQRVGDYGVVFTSLESLRADLLCETGSSNVVFRRRIKYESSVN
jgi:hypothetical protein